MTPDVELSGHRRQDVSARAAKMHRVRQAGPWRPAVRAPLERRVRRHCADYLATSIDLITSISAVSISICARPDANSPTPLHREQGASWLRLPPHFVQV